MSQYTPYRTNGDDEGAVNNHGFFSRLFSSAKKPRTVERSTDFTASDHRHLAWSPRHDDIPSPGASATAPLVHGSATMASMDGANRLNGLSGSNRLNGAIVPAAAAETERGPTTANGIATAGAISVAEWKPHAALASFKIGAPGKDQLRPYRRRRIPTKPESYTLVGRSRKRPPPKDWDPADFQNILQSSRSLLCRPNEDDVSDLTFRTNTTRRVLGTKQRGSRLIPPVEKNPKVSVSFREPQPKEVNFSEPTQPTPRTPDPTSLGSKPRLKRQQTPGVRQQPATTPAVESPSMQSPFSNSSTSVTSILLQRPPRTAFNLDGPYELDGEMSRPRRYSPGGTKFDPDVNEYHPDPERMLTNIRPLKKTKPGRFVRPEKEHKERPAQTLYTVDDDDEVVKEEKSQNVAKSPTNTWGDNMFQNQKGKWKCGMCWSYNDLKFKNCSSCEAENTQPTKRAKREANIIEKDDANTSTSTPAHSETTASAAPFSFSSTQFAAPKAGAFPFAAASPSATSSFSFGVKQQGSITSTQSPAPKAGEFSFGVAPPPASGGFSFAVKQQDSLGTAHPSGTTMSVKADAKAAVGGVMANFNAVGSVARSTSAQTSVSSGAFALGSASESKPDDQKDQPTLTFPISVAQEDDDLRRKKRRATDDDDKAKPPSGGVSFLGPIAAGGSVLFGGPGATAGGVSFGGAGVPSPATPAFTFGAPVAPTPLQDPAEPPTAPAFTFGSAAPAVAKPSVTFAATPKASESIPSFSFGAGSMTPAPSSGSILFAGHTPGVSTDPFGGSSTPAPPFSFSGGSSTPGRPSYSFQAASTPAPPSFDNGSSTPAQNTNPFSSGSTPAPSLGNTPGVASTPSVSFGATPAPSVSFSATSAPSISFGSAAPASAGVSFGATPAPSVSFGATPASSVSFGATPAPPVSFGATPAPSVSFGTTPAPPVSFGGPTPASAGVSFGAPASEVAFGAPAVGFGAAPAFGAATPAPSVPTFGFGQTPAQPTNNSFGAQSAPMQNFGPGVAVNSFGVAPSMTTPSAGGFTMGSTAKSTGRRIVRAKRRN